MHTASSAARKASKSAPPRVIGALPALPEASRKTDDRQIERAAEHRRRNRAVGGDEAEHRGHVRLDHARTLAHAADGHAASTHGRAHARLLGAGVGGHHRALGREPVRRSAPQRLLRLAHPREQPVERQAAADHPGRGDEHMRLVDPQLARGREGRDLRVPHPLRTGAGVGAAGVGEDRLHPAALDDLAVVDDRRGRHLVGGENRRGGAGLVRNDQRDIFPALILDRRRNSGGAESCSGDHSAADCFNLAHGATSLPVRSADVPLPLYL